MFPLFFHLTAMKWWDQMPWFLSFECWVLSHLFHFPLSSSSNDFSFSLLSAIIVVSSAYLRLLMFLPAILILACASSSPEFLMMYFANKLNRQGDNIQPWHTPFPIWNQSIVPCSVLTPAFWLAYRFLRRQVRLSGTSISLKFFQFLVIHTVKVFYIVNKAEELFCSFYDPMDVGNLIPGSSASSKSSLNIWKFSVHILLKPSMENFEHCTATVWDECNCVVLWTFFGIAFLWDWNENCSFGATAEFFPNLLAYWVKHFHRIIF